MQKTPDVVGEGAYGCVHKPALQCENENQSPYTHTNSRTNRHNTISKLMLPKYAETEIADYAIVAEADPHKQYYPGMPYQCSPKSTPQNVKSAEKCEIYKQTDANIKELSMLIIPDGGPDLISYAESLAKLRPSARIKSLSHFWKEANRLFKGILAFQTHDVVHDDVKPQNILYNPATHRANFIDFGFITRIDKLVAACKSNQHNIAAYFFWSYPCEFKFMNRTPFMDIARLDVQAKEDYFENLMQELQNDRKSKISTAMHIFFDTICQNYSENDKMILIERYLSDFKQMIMDEMVVNNYDRFIQKSVRTVDVFGLGMSLQYVLSETRPYKFFNKQKTMQLRECFYNMMHPNINKRYTIDMAYAEFLRIMRVNKKRYHDNKKMNRTQYDIDFFDIGHPHMRKQKRRTRKTR